MFFQVLPPSVDLYTPSPHEELCRLLFSPVPTHTMSGLLCDTATSPIEIIPSWSKTGSQVVPLLTVFQTPPPADPTYIIRGLLSTTAKASTRPPIIAGPMVRHLSAFRTDSFTCIPTAA